MAFPEISTEWIQLLCERCEANGFDEKDFRTAINKLIDTFSFSRPTIANVIQLIQKPLRAELPPGYKPNPKSDDPILNMLNR